MSISKINTNSIAAGASPTMTDLTLSGGVYLGGTGAANYFDDYEEGTFTPTVKGSSTTGTVAYSRQRGIYTKVGNMVNFSIHMTWNSGTGTGFLLIPGLPFTPTTTIQSNDMFYGVNISFIASLTVPAGHIPAAVVFPGGTEIRMYDIPTGGPSGAELAYDGAATLIMTGTYQTDS